MVVGNAICQKSQFEQLRIEREASILWETGEKHHSKSSFDSAITYYQKSVTLHQNTHRYFTLAELFQYLQKIDSAKKYYSKSIEVNPKNTDALLKRGIILKDQEQYDLALNDLYKVTNLNSSYDSFSYPNIALCLTFSGQYQKAIPYYNRSIDLDPEDYLLICNRGICKKMIGKSLGALQDFNRALELNPDYPNGLEQKGIHLMEIRSANEAMVTFERLVKIKDDPIHKIQLGWAYLASNNYQDAIETLGSVAARPEFKEDQFFFLGLSHFSMGNYEKAGQYFNELLQDSPENPKFIYYCGLTKNAINPGSGCQELLKAKSYGFEIEDKLMVNCL